MGAAVPRPVVRELTLIRARLAEMGRRLVVLACLTGCGSPPPPTPTPRPVDPPPVAVVTTPVDPAQRARDRTEVVRLDAAWRSLAGCWLGTPRAGSTVAESRAVISLLHGSGWNPDRECSTDWNVFHSELATTARDPQVVAAAKAFEAVYEDLHAAPNAGSGTTPWDDLVRISEAFDAARRDLLLAVDLPAPAEAGTVLPVLTVPPPVTAIGASTGPNDSKRFTAQLEGGHVDPGGGVYDRIDFLAPDRVALIPDRNENDPMPAYPGRTWGVSRKRIGDQEWEKPVSVGTIGTDGTLADLRLVVDTDDAPVAAFGDGLVRLVFLRQWSPRAVTVSTSRDGGATWSRPRVLGKLSTSDDSVDSVPGVRPSQINLVWEESSRKSAWIQLDMAALDRPLVVTRGDFTAHGSCFADGAVWSSHYGGEVERSQVGGKRERVGKGPHDTTEIRGCHRDALIVERQGKLTRCEARGCTELPPTGLRSATEGSIGADDVPWLVDQLGAVVAVSRPGGTPRLFRLSTELEVIGATQFAKLPHLVLWGKTGFHVVALPVQ